MKNLIQTRFFKFSLGVKLESEAILSEKQPIWKKVHSRLQLDAFVYYRIRMHIETKTFILNVKYLNV